MRSTTVLLVSALLVVASDARAQEDLDSILDGFEDDTPASTATSEREGSAPPSAEIEHESSWSVSGDVYLATSIAYAHDAPNGSQPDDRGLTKLRVGSHLELDVEWAGVEGHASGSGFRDLVYPIKKRNEFNHRVLQTYEADLEWDELWLRVSPLQTLDVQVGRQVVAWGRSETLRVVDVLNPIDNREPGVVDLADLRLPVAMTRIDYYPGRIGFTGIAIHEQRTDKQPEPGSEFFPSGIPLPGRERPSNGGRDTEWALAVNGRFQGWDASLHWARVFADSPTLDPDTGLLKQARITLVGATGNYVIGNWLLKGEVARNRGLRYFGIPRRRFARSDVLLGIEYYGLRDASLSIDVVARRLHGFEDQLKRVPDVAERNAFESAIRYSGSFWNDSLRVTLLAVAFGEFGRDGSAYRASFSRELRSGLIAELGVAVYEGGHSSLFDAFDENDRVFMSIKQSF